MSLSKRQQTSAQVPPRKKPRRLENDTSSVSPSSKSTSTSDMNPSRNDTSHVTPCRRTQTSSVCFNDVDVPTTDDLSGSYDIYWSDTSETESSSDDEHISDV